MTVDMLSPPPKRLTLQWVKVRLRDVYRNACNAIVFNTIGYVLNRLPLFYMLAHRPDFHADFHRLDNYRELLSMWVRHNRSNNAGDLPRLYMLLLNINQVLNDGVPGDFVELGVYKGNSAAILAHNARAYDRHLYLFDTFAGFDERDLHEIGFAMKKEFSDTSLERVQLLVGTQNVTYVQGFFPESADRMALPSQIAIAHIDCDLHDPMLAALERFYPRMSHGGIILMHDYGSGHWAGATRAVDEFFADKPERPIVMPDKSGTAVVRVVSR